MIIQTKSLIKINLAVSRQMTTGTVPGKFIKYGKLDKFLQLTEFAHDIINQKLFFYAGAINC